MEVFDGNISVMRIGISSSYFYDVTEFIGFKFINYELYLIYKLFHRTNYIKFSDIRYITFNNDEVKNKFEEKIDEIDKIELAWRDNEETKIEWRELYNKGFFDKKYKVIVEELEKYLKEVFVEEDYKKFDSWKEHGYAFAIKNIMDIINSLKERSFINEKE